MLSLDTIVDEIKLSTKQMGYKKRKLVWYKPCDRLTLVFSIQKSLYSPDTWYYRFGVCLHDIATGSVSSIDNCQITFRMDHIYQNEVIKASKIVNLIERWESMYGTLLSLRRYAVQGKLSGQCSTIALRYLTSNPWENQVF